MQGNVSAQPLGLLPLVDRGGHPGMQRETGRLRDPGAALLQATLRRQGLQTTNSRRLRRRPCGPVVDRLRCGR